MNPYLMLAVAEGFGEGLVPALLTPDLEPEALLAAPPEPPVVPPRVAARLRQPDLGAAAARLAAAASRHGLTVLTPAHPDWPPRFATMPLRPLVLFVRGDVAALRREPAVAVVGSRTPTPYGSEAAALFAGGLAGAGITLWSGLARGIDQTAHAACVAAGIPTVAVLAGGLASIYPPEHDGLSREILAAGGCLCTELPPEHRARRGHFPRRNRLIAAGTPAVLVVEASLTSGALHTARFAAECGSDVFAVPGPWSSERSQGCHRLLSEGARIVEGPEALLRDLGVQPERTSATAHRLAVSADEQAILGLLQQGPRPGDLLQRECGLPRGTFLKALFGLQQRGAIASVPGDLWRRAAPPAR